MNTLTERMLERGLWVLLLAVFMATGCKDDGGGGVHPDPEYTVTFVAQDEDGGSLSGVDFTSDVKSAADVSSLSVTARAGTNVSMTAAKDGFQNGSESITITQANDGRSVVITLARDEAETAEITANLLLEGSAYSDVRVFNDTSDEELATSAGVLTLTRALETELPIRIEGPDIETQSETLTFDETKTLDISLERKAAGTVTLTVTPEIGQFNAQSRGGQYDDRTSYELTIGGETFTNTGPSGALLQEGQSVQVAVPAGEEVTINGRFIYVQAARDIDPFFHRSLATGEMSVNPDGDTSVTLNLSHQLACADGIDNDLVDGAGNDETAVGCVADDSPTFESSDPDWVYDASDDDERLLFSRQTYNLQQKKLFFVSSEEGERRTPLVGNTFPDAIVFALGPVVFYLDNAIEANQDGEESAMEIKCREEGSNTHADDLKPYISDIIPDDPEVNGWRTSRVTDYTGELFAQEGLECSLALQHGTLVRGEDPGDGNDDVVIATEERSTNLRRIFAVEPETLPAELRPEANTQMVGTREKLEN